ncbi:hypothetical protein MSSAC_3828 [Methanosarcina siciliae C2J]|uniref:Uncharacterized protein n=1 Tax=Methanosarcina siciliae C2J TaxID=1434118 RepID=A0A0E3PSM4_9EURY|nr:hypothetical protein MSSAC_3828 [Methanosarcina siciliae C2J]
MALNIVIVYYKKRCCRTPKHEGKRNIEKQSDCQEHKKDNQLSIIAAQSDPPLEECKRIYAYVKEYTLHSYDFFS